MRLLKKAKDKIEVGGILTKVDYWDFGLMSYPDKRIKIDRALWNKFVQLRYEFETTYNEIENKFNKKL